MMDDDDNDELPPPKVTDAPAAIWLVYGDIERDCTHWECARNGDVGWCEDKQFDSDVEYVRADTIEAQAERIRVLREALEKIAQFDSYEPAGPAANTAPAAAIPPGYALVPIEPTPEIIATGAVALMKASDSDLDATKEEIAATYRAMIAAAGDKP